MENLVRTVGALCGLAFLVGLPALPWVLRAKLTDIQLGTRPEAVLSIVRQPRRRRAARIALIIDFGFIAAYWTLYLAIAVLLAHGDGAGWQTLGVATALTATATALLDVVENGRTLGVLALGRPDGSLAQRQLDKLRHASLAKWAASAITVALVASVFRGSDLAEPFRWLFFALAALGATAVLLRRGRRPLLFLFFFALAATLPVLAAILLASPDTIKGF